MDRRIRTDIDLGLDLARMNQVLDRAAERWRSRISSGMAAGIDAATGGLGVGGAASLSGQQARDAWRRATQPISPPGEKRPGERGGKDPRLTDHLYYRSGAWAGSIGAGAVQGVMGSTPGAGITALGQGAQGSMDAMVRGLEKAADSAGELGRAIPVLGGFLKASGGAAAVGFGLLGAGVNQRYQRLHQLAALEHPLAQIKALSGDGGGLNSGYFSEYKMLGFGPQRAAAMRLSYLRASGGQLLRGTNAAELSLAGFTPEVAGRYQASLLPGGGGVGDANHVNQVLGMAQAMGLKGRAGDDFVSRIASVVSQNSNQGISTNLGGLNAFLYGLHQTRERTLQGTGGIGAMQGLQGMAQGALAQLKAPLRGLGLAMMLQQGIANSDGSLLGTMDYLERAQGIPGRLNGMLRVNGPQMHQLAAAGVMSVRQARGLSRAGMARPKNFKPEQFEELLKYSPSFAEQEMNQLRRVTTPTGEMKKGELEALNKTIIALPDQIEAAMSNSINGALVQKLLGAMEALIHGINGMINGPGF